MARRMHEDDAERRVSAWRAAVVGARAAGRAAGVIAGGLPALLVAPPTLAPRSLDPTAAAAATRAALAALRWLARLPGRRWRDTCLFRATAECLVLRAAGLPALVRLGVAVEAPDVVAHAWAECPGVRCATADGGETSRYRVLAPPAGRATA